jgi:serine/threonine-protein kinase
MVQPMLLADASTVLTPPFYLQAIGAIFKTFDQQDSGNVSYGVRVAGERYFVKTAGDPANTKPYLDHAGRVALLRNAVRLRARCDHPSLCRLHNVIESPTGPLLVYAWAEGELLHVPRAQRADPQSSYQRFRALPVSTILDALDQLYELHRLLAADGWVACDFYDGCLLYDFTINRLHVIDLDTYHQGPFTNTMGRMFGSSSFMAPEEFELGAPIDQQTTVFNLGRTAALFLGNGALTPMTFRGNDAIFAVVRRACTAERALRFATVAAFVAAWRAACNNRLTN